MIPRIPFFLRAAAGSTRRFFVTSAAVTLIGLGAVASADPIVDQSNFCCLSGGQGLFGPDPTFPFAFRELGQSFIVANDGLLTGIDLFGYAQRETGEGLVTVHIVSLTDGLPSEDVGGVRGTTSTFLAFNPETASTSQNHSTVAVRGLAIPVSAGDTFAMILSAEATPGETAFLFATNGQPDSAVYAQGSGFVRVGENATPQRWQPFNHGDLLFRTYLECSDPSRCMAAPDPGPPDTVPTSVPESTSVQLMATGLVALLCTSLIRRHQREAPSRPALKCRQATR